MSQSEVPATPAPTPKFKPGDKVKFCITTKSARGSWSFSEREGTVIRIGSHVVSLKYKGRIYHCEADDITPLDQPGPLTRNFMDAGKEAK